MPGPIVDVWMQHPTRRFQQQPIFESLTNYPMLTAAACLEGLADLGLSPDGQAAFLGGTARRVFRLD